MEGVTDSSYRKVVQQIYPEWDHFYTDFLRVPTQGKIKEGQIKQHYGPQILSQEKRRLKNSFQILTPAKANIRPLVEKVSSYNFPSLDLNLGCPSKKVNSHMGGAYLLSDLKQLATVIKTIRENFKGCFTTKIRLGYRDSILFKKILHLLEDHGVDAITIHGRTRDQLYRGTADWSFIKAAVKEVNIPIIGNGDIWTVKDIEKMFNQCQVYAVMAARGALKTPWLASDYRAYLKNHHDNEEESWDYNRIGNLQLYFSSLEEEYRKQGQDKSKTLNRFKSLSRYPFDDLQNSEQLKSSLLRSRSLEQFNDILYSL